MNNYLDILENVKSTIKCKYNDYGVPKAFKVNNEEEYKLVLECVNLGQMSCYDIKKHYPYNYKGADWYFFLESKEDLGMEGKYTRYWQETLTEKKERFEEFCKQYE